ncbi:plasmid maintenance system antidote protein, XRE family [Methylobacterium sp. ap11]|uniref:HigA family addiction module antitoxin n=1 Tax=Methylobacterium sp. ap11 TaxID=1761799 RepID=UPI0008C3E486|nr:HigA family addiction module antitoxin [Methylobacterium sp. ap11]SEP19325.1 plasmid maintenance system antidote protein, XRE family [Methylobacterium sp. ap11]
MPRTRIHPGEYLAGEYLGGSNLSADELADALDLPRSRIGDLMHKRRGIDADLALRLGRFFGTTAQFWSNLQAAHDLSTVRATTVAPGRPSRPTP